MKTSKMLIMSYIGDHVWLITSRHTEPDLLQLSVAVHGSAKVWGISHSSSMFGWKIRFTKPMLGLLYGY